MLKLFFISTMFLSISAYAQMDAKPDPNSTVNAEEQVNGLPGGSSGRAYSVKTKARAIKTPPAIAPTQNTTTPANCADSLGGSGANTFTACEAAKRSR